MKIVVYGLAPLSEFFAAKPAGSSLRGITIAHDYPVLTTGPTAIQSTIISVF